MPSVLEPCEQSTLKKKKKDDFIVLYVIDISAKHTQITGRHVQEIEQ